MWLKKVCASVAIAFAAVTFSANAKAADIVDTAVAADDFNTLVAAVKAAGLVETLKGEGPFTVFAPTDEAFAGLGKKTLDTLLKPENKDTLAAILTYHVVPGKVMANDVMGQETNAKTVQGGMLFIQAAGGTVMVGNQDYTDRSKYADVVQADIEADNGVIHVIDKVVLPPNVSVPPAM